MRIKENKGKNLLSCKITNNEELGCEWSLCKESRFKPFVDKMWSIDEFGMLVLSLAQKLGLP